MKVAVRAVAFLAVGAAIGCGDDQPLGDPPRFPVPGCEGIDPAPCDVRTTDCQTRLLVMAACLRGNEAGALPPVTVVTEAQFTADLTDWFAKREPPPAVDHWEAAFRLLGFVQPGAFSVATNIAESAAFIWGYYRWDTKDIVVVDHGERFNNESASPVLVHELVHALQDRDVDLRAFEMAHGESYDSSLASRALVEGEARMYETRYRASLLGLHPDRIDWTQRFQNLLEFDERELQKEASPYTATPRSFPYEWGARYVHFTWEAGGPAAVLARYMSPPLTTRVLLASVDHAVDPEGAPGALTPPEPPATWTAVGQDALGAWGAFLLLFRSAPGLAAARELALGWRSDGLWIYSGAPATETTALVWDLEFASEQAAATVVNIETRSLQPAAIRQQGTHVVIAMTDGSQALDWAFSPRAR